MIESETIEIVYSELVGKSVESEEEPDYRAVVKMRLTEENEVRLMDDDNPRIV